MSKYLKEIVKSLKECGASDIRITETIDQGKSFDGMHFVKDDFDCDLAVNNYYLLLCYQAKLHAEPPSLEEYQKLNDLTAKTHLGKHCIEYDGATGYYRYKFSFDDKIEYSSFEEVRKSIRASFAKAAKGYEIILCPDMALAYREIADFIG